MSLISGQSRELRPAHAAAVAAATAALIVPWLNPFAPGPSPSVMPWLVSLLCVGVLMLLAPVVGVAVIARAWLAAALLSACIGLMQYAGATRALYPWVNQTNLGEAFGNLRQRNQFASLLNIGQAVLLWRAVRGDETPRTQPLALAGAALLAAANAASASRTGLLQILLLAALSIIWGVSTRKPVSRLLFTMVASYIAAALALPVLIGLAPGIHGVFARMADSSEPCASRMTLWSNVLHLITLQPWTGWGWGELDYAHYATLYSGPRFCDILDNAHDLPLHLAVELGVPVALAFCALVAWTVWRAAPWRERRPDVQLAWAVIVLIGVHSLLEYPLWYGPFLTAMVLSVLVVAGRDGGGPAPWRSARWRFVPAAALLGALAYAQWDYHRISQIYTPPESRDAAYRDDTVAKISRSWLFADQVRFAVLTMAPVRRDNAPAMYVLARDMLHYSPEPAVIERLIESQVMLGRDDEALVELARYKAAFPAEHAQWAQGNLRFGASAPASSAARVASQAASR